VARGVIGERIRGNAQLVGYEGECRLWNDLARPQQAARIAESAELQRETELVRVAAPALYGGEIGGTQGPVPDQHRFGDGQGEQLLELLAGDGAASRHGDCPK
jgi:hypothetical protein